jgi:hypothetical protein
LSLIYDNPVAELRRKHVMSAGQGEEEEEKEEEEEEVGAYFESLLLQPLDIIRGKGPVTKARQECAIRGCMRWLRAPINGPR